MRGAVRFSRGHRPEAFPFIRWAFWGPTIFSPNLMKKQASSGEGVLLLPYCSARQGSTTLAFAVYCLPILLALHAPGCMVGGYCPKGQNLCNALHSVVSHFVGVRATCRRCYASKGRNHVLFFSKPPFNGVLLLQRHKACPAKGGRPGNGTS